MICQFYILKNMENNIFFLFKWVIVLSIMMIEMIMLNDVNFMGNLMGGNLLCWMDIVLGICAGKYCECYVVMVFVDYVSFIKVIKVGDVIIFEVSIICVFCIFVEVFVEVYVIDIMGYNSWCSNLVYYIFVVFDQENGMFVLVLLVILVMEIEQQCYDSVLCCCEMCLILAGRLKLENVYEVWVLFEVIIYKQFLVKSVMVL